MLSGRAYSEDRFVIVQVFGKVFDLGLGAKSIGGAVALGIVDYTDTRQTI